MWLKQSTAVDIGFGPFVDATDGATPETALTISQADVRLKKNGGAWAQKSDATAAAHEENGWYEVSLNATDTGTVGELIVAVTETGARPVSRVFQVVPANVYDSLVSGSDALQIDVLQWAGVAFATAKATLIDEVWDEVLTGATHNIQNSAGRRLRTLQDVGNYVFGAVWINTASANANAVFPDDGTFLNPVNSLANALTVAAAATQTIKRLFVMSGSSITLAGTFTGWTIGGENYSLALGGQDISNSAIHAAESVTGTATGTAPIFQHCEFGAVTLPPCEIQWGHLGGTLTIGSAGNYQLFDCAGAITATTPPTIDLGAAVGATTISIRRWSGGLTLANVKTGDIVVIDVVSGGTITIGGTGGTVHVRGMCTVSDSSGGTVSITQTSVINHAGINAEVVDALATDTYAEPASVPAATSSLKDKIGWLFTLARNKRTTTGTTDTVRNDADSATIGSSALSDDGTTFSRGEYS